MESQLPRACHPDEQNPAGLHSGVEGEDEGHHEKQSVIKKMKAKAKKIKNTLIKQGYGHGHDEYGEKDELVEEPEIHDAPINESAAVTGSTQTNGDQPAQGGTNLDRPSTEGPRYDSPIVETKSGEDIYPQLPPEGINKRTPEDVHAEKENTDQVGATTAMEENTDQGLPSHAQVKTIDPAGRGSEEAEGITPVVRSFNKMGNSDEIPKTGQGEELYKRSHDQSAPERMPQESSDSIPRSYDATNPQLPPEGINRTGKDIHAEEENPDQVGAPTAMEGIRGSEEAAEGITPVVRSFNKMGISDEKTKIGQGEELYTRSHDQFAPERMPHESPDSIPTSYDATNPQLPPEGINRTGKDIHTEEENPDQVGAPTAMEGIRGSEEAEGISPVVRSFNMGISDEKPKTGQGEELYTGSQDQFAPERMPHESSDSIPRSYDATNPQLPPEGINRTGKDIHAEEENPDQVGAPTAMEGIRGSEEAEEITPVVRSFNNMGISDEKPKTGQGEELYAGSQDQFAPERMPHEISDSIPRSYDATNPQLPPEGINRTGKDIHAEEENPDQVGAPTAMEGIRGSEKAEGITPVVRSFNNMGISDEKPKTGQGEELYAGSQDQFAPERMPHESSDSIPRSYDATNPQLPPEGINSTGKDIHAEEENPDQVGAPTGMITESFSNRKGEKNEEVPSDGGGGKGEKIEEVPSDGGGGKGEKNEEVPSDGGGQSNPEMVSDAIPERQPDESEEQRPMGKVTESKEVAGVEGSGVRVVNRFTGAISSWLGGQGGQTKSTPGTTS